MSSNATTAPNPLARLAWALPAGFGRLLSFGGRIAAGALATAIAADQSFARTRSLALVAAVLVLATCLPVPARLAGRLPWLGAGVAFFAGALLLHLPAGVAMLAAGAGAALGAAVDDVQQGRATGVPSFFAGFGIVAALVAVIVLGVEG